jgi:hypothetical protein
MRRKLIAGNWKMHGNLAENEALLAGVLAGMGDVKAGVAVCVPFPYLAQFQAKLTGSAVAWGAQNMSQHAKGAYTGEVSASMLKDFGCAYVIVGHSERRALYGESDAGGGREIRRRPGGRPDADPLRGRDPGGARNRRHRAGRRLASWMRSSPSAALPPWPGPWWPTSRSGRSAPARPPRRSRPRRCTPSFAARWAPWMPPSPRV